MARKKRGAKAGKADWAAIGRWTLRSASVLALVGLAIGLTLGVDRLRTHAGAQMRLASASADAPPVAFSWPTLDGRPGESWLPAADQDELVRVAERAIGDDDPLSAAPLRRIAERLGDTGWFIGDPGVRRVGAGRVHIEGEWRIPAAVVRWEGRDRLVSSGAFPMPPVYLAGRSGRPVITGVFVGPVVEGSNAFGEPWRDPGVMVALDLVALLRGAGFSDHLGGVDVDGYLNGGAIEIVSAAGNRVVWGSPVHEWTPGEPSVEEKVDRLRALVDRTGSIDAGQARIEIHRARVEIDRTGIPGPGGDD